MQTGGSVSSGTVALGVGEGAVGRYELAAGSVTARWKVAVGGGGHGEFAQTGGNLSTFIFTVGEPFDLAAGAPLRRSSFVISAGMADISFSAIVGAYFQDGASGGLPDAGYGQLQITGSAVLKADFMNVWATGLLKIDGGTLSVRQLSARPNTFAMSDGVLQFTGAASYTDIDTGLGNTPLPLSFGAGLGSGNPTVRLASNSTLSLPQIDVGIFGKGRLEIGPGAQLNTTTASLGQGFGSVPGSGQAAVAGAGARWKNSGALVIGGLSGPGSQLTLTDGGTLVNGGTLTLRPGSSIYVAGGSLSAPKIISQGTIDLDQGGQHTWAGDLELRSGSLLLVKAPFTAQGAVDVAAGARIENSNFMRFEGMVALQQGALVSGDGTKVFAGSLKVSGDDPGVFTDLSTDALVLLAPSNTYFADIGAGSFDRYVVNGQFVLGGTLKLVSFGGYTGHTGDHFDLFDAAHLSGSFARIDTSSFTLAQGLSWDFSQLGSSGVVSITGVPAPIPEPGTWALWLAGLAWLGARACRRGL